MPPNFAPAAVPIESADIMAGQPQLNGALTTMNADIIGAPVGGGPGLGPTPASSGSLPGRPSLPDDPVIPHNGFATLEEGERAFVHLLKKAGIDATWTWDQTMRAIITDPLYKALNSLAEKKNCWQKVSNRNHLFFFFLCVWFGNFCLTLYPFLLFPYEIVCGWVKRERT